ncbi:E3 ubiquitin-protein ligase AMFR [Dirofilaria immitis]|nr:E3 ubiquitin-protein ligase AMFR [Dirofilaria immitis]
MDGWMKFECNDNDDDDDDDNGDGDDDDDNGDGDDDDNDVREDLLCKQMERLKKFWNDIVGNEIDYSQFETRNGDSDIIVFREKSSKFMLFGTNIHVVLGATIAATIATIMDARRLLHGQMFYDFGWIAFQIGFTTAQGFAIYLVLRCKKYLNAKEHWKKISNQEQLPIIQLSLMVSLRIHPFLERMPLMPLDPFDGLLALARHTPIPTLNSYIIISLLLTAGSTFYAKLTFAKDEIENRLRDINETFRKTDSTNALVTSTHLQHFYYILLHPTFGWIFINMFCAILALFAKLATYATVGKLGAQESILLRDRLCNFLLYKAVFLFGVLNSVVHEEVIAWILWFALLASVAALQTLNLLQLISSIPPKGVLLRIMGLAILLLLMSFAFVSFAFTAFRLFSVSIALFILADAIKSLLRSIYVISKCALLLDIVSIYLSSINLSTLTYYLEFLHDLAIDCIDLLHYSHMLLYSQVVLSMACIVISMQLRSFYKSFLSRLERHIKYKRICKHIDEHYRKATQIELNTLTDWCAICWEQMDSARKLPCNHFFHEWCLRNWLEQDNSCPTCRLSLPPFGNVAVVEEPRGRQHAPLVHPFSHVFHFSGTRYARWLPSFSVELSHNITTNFFQRNRFGDATNSQLNSLAEQVREMFPQFEIATIIEDLRESGSVQATVENILENRFPQQNIDSEEEIWNTGDSTSSSNSSTESSSEYEETSPASGKYIASPRGEDLQHIYGKDIPDTRNSDSLRQREGHNS